MSFALLIILLAGVARAADGAPDSPPAGAPAGASSGANGGAPIRANNPEEEDFSSSPYTQYGQFNEDKAEEEQDKFFQYGRFFGVSLGLGFETADQNRGSIWTGGFPLIDLKMNYWFDFNFALDLDVYFVKHSFNDKALGATDVQLIRAGIDLKYYFDIKNLSSAITFANPYIVAGLGEYSETQSTANVTQAANSNNFTTIGFCAGAGLEFTLKPHSTYFNAEAKIHAVHFSEDDTNSFAPQFANSAGNLYTFVGSILFTW